MVRVGAAPARGSRRHNHVKRIGKFTFPKPIQIAIRVNPQRVIRVNQPPVLLASRCVILVNLFATLVFLALVQLFIPAAYNFPVRLPTDV